MYLYKITNLINNKVYVGITNDYKRRWREHKTNHNPKSLIAKAIRKYGKENFSFDILDSGMSLEQSEIRETETIQLVGSLVPNGYNISKGGQITAGTNNGRALLTTEEVQYIKSNRDKPMYELYDRFSEIISYNQFRKIYNHKVYLEILPTVEPYAYNMEFGCQFNNGNFTLEEIKSIRKEYSQGIHWKEAYKEYRNHCSEERFWQIYSGRGYKYVMPEIFTPDNIKKHSSKSAGAKNPKAKLTEEQVLDIRALNMAGISNKEIYSKYPIVSHTTIRDIINKKTWKTLL